MYCFRVDHGVGSKHLFRDRPCSDLKLTLRIVHKFQLRKLLHFPEATLGMLVAMLFEPALSYRFFLFKGIVQRILRGVNNKLK
jgi:hypothetical protein